MKKVILIEDMVLSRHWQRKLYLFLLKRQPGLIVYIFGLIWVWFLNELHLIKQETYLQKSWKYLDNVKNRDILLKKFWKKNPFKKHWFNDLSGELWTTRMPLFLFADYLSENSIQIVSTETVTLSEEHCFPLVYRQKIFNTKKELLFRKCLHVLWTITVLTGMGIGIGLVSLYFGASYFIMPMFISYFKIPSLIVLNILPVVFMIYVFYFLFNRVYVSFFMTAFIAIGLSLVNYYKLMFRNDPLLASDFIFFNESVNMAGKYPIHINYKIILVVMAVIIGIIMAIYLTDGRISKKRYRIVGLISMLIIGNLLFDHVYASSEYVKKTENLEKVNRWSATQVYISRGFVYPFILSVFSSIEKVPEEYNKKEAISELGTYTYENIPDSKKVNVISIMLEAFQDFSKYDQIQFEKNPYEIWDGIKEESVSGELVTNIFAGGTIDTERSFMTGYSVLPNFRKNVPSYIRYFSEQGYYVEGSHPGYDWFYNRKNVNEYLGFDTYHFFENYYKDFTGYIIKDEIFFPALIDLYDRQEGNDKPYFSFNVTYQNHGPYSTEPRTEERFLMDQGYSVENYNILNNYLSGIYDTQVHLKKMLDELDQRSEPFVVIVFGDHNPWLGDNNSVYNMLNIDFDMTTDTGFYNYYETPYIIWGNQAAKDALGTELVGKGPQIGPYFLMNTFFELAGLKGNEYMQLSTDMMHQMEVIHTTKRYKVNGELAETLDASDRKKLDQYESVQYYLRNEKR